MSKRYTSRPDDGDSRYGRKKKWRLKNCGGVPLPFFPEVMMIPPPLKPWGG